MKLCCFRLLNLLGLLPLDLVLASLDDSLVDLLFLFHSPEDLPHDCMPSENQIGSSNDDHLHQNEVSDIYTPGWISQEWSEA